MHFHIALACSILAAIAHAQGVDRNLVLTRSAKPSRTSLDFGGSKGIAFGLPSDVGGPAQLSLSMDSGVGNSDVVLPFDWVGDIVQVGTNQLVVCGASPGPVPTGWVVLVSVDLDTASLQIVESAQFPGFDLFDVAWNPVLSMLGFIDWSSSNLLFGPCFPDSPGSVLPTAIGVAATPLNCPTLKALKPSVSVVGSAFQVTGSSDGTVCSVSPGWGGWEITTSDPEPRNVWVTSVFGGHGAPLKVASLASQVGPNTAFTVTDTLRSVTVASGTVASTREWVSIGPVADFYDYPGYPHVVSGLMSATSDPFRPLLRYGEPAPHAAPATVGVSKSDLLATSVYPGSPEAVFFADVSLPTLSEAEDPAQPVPIVGYLLLGIGFRGNNAPPDPITGTGSNARLQFVTAVTVNHSQMFRDQPVVAATALPNFAFLTDCVLLTQWVFQDPSDPAILIYSDISGSRFLPAGSGLFAASTSSTSSASPPSISAPSGPAVIGQSTWAQRRAMFRLAVQHNSACLGECATLQVLRTNAGVQ